ncbi:hypothetical protein [Bacillus thuringiensis]|uniref:hypothetical protein n=1 Tax=Bacillus thuringiensis TaxID=1428 RepID=UPI0021D6578A|nr:hypothetical protein [Bacillus thuringiensis]MCU7667097.1 hypothetical protein [Bacillus thuringiensis]
MKGKITVFLTGVICISTLSACGSDDVLIKVGKEKIQKEEVYNYLVKEYGKDYLLGEIEYRLLIQNAELTDKEVQTKIKVIEKENGVKTLKDLVKKTNTSEDEIMKRARRLVAEEKILIEKANLNKEEIKGAFESRKYKMFADFIVVDSKEKADKIVSLAKSKKERNLENAAHKVMEDYHLHYNWNVELNEGLLGEEVLAGTMGLESGQVSNVIKKDGQYYIYEIKSRRTAELEDEKLKIVRELASQRGVDITTILEDLKKENKVKVEDENIEKLLK